MNLPALNKMFPSIFLTLTLGLPLIHCCRSDPKDFSNSPCHSLRSLTVGIYVCFYCPDSARLAPACHMHALQNTHKSTFKCFEVEKASSSVPFLHHLQSKTQTTHDKMHKKGVWDGKRYYLP